MKINLSAERQYNVNIKELSTSLLFMAASVALVAFGGMTGFIPAISVGIGLGAVGLVGLFYSIQRKKTGQEKPTELTPLLTTPTSSAFQKTLNYRSINP